MNHREALYQALRDANMEAWAEQLPAQLDTKFSSKRYGDYPKWLNAVEALPAIKARDINLDTGLIKIGDSGEVDTATRNAIEVALHELHPWRKGPYSVFGIHVDTEWRSDWKWERIAPHLGDLKGKSILDVGCANGYHCLRMHAMGAALVIGVDPSLLYAMQFQALQHFMQPLPVYVLPFTLEEVPDNQQAFDTVFSMGVLYHRRSPFDHLISLKEQLKPGGQLVLETLVIPGKHGEVLVPQERYARMRNVWFLPSIPEMEHWLDRTGFTDIRTVDTNVTSTEEQRSTDWMRFESLAESLDPNDPARTVEGYPAPCRATFIATRP